MTVVVLRLGRKGENSGDNAIRLLSKLFSTELGYEKKLVALHDEFHIGVTKEISREVLDVCNLSTGVLNKGITIGETRGEMRGREQQAKDTAFELQKMGLTVDNIAKAVKVCVDVVKDWLSEPQATPAK